MIDTMADENVFKITKMNTEKVGHWQGPQVKFHTVVISRADSFLHGFAMRYCAIKELKITFFPSQETWKVAI